MTLLPVVARELRVASRRRSTHLSRVTAGGIAIVLGGWITLTLPKVFPTTFVGAQLFKVLSWFAVVYALISGAKATADTISSEKRQGTLGLLFLTDLKGYDVLLGKLVAASLGTFYGVMAVIPVLAIPLLMGGVTAGEFWRVGLAIFAALIFSLSAGIMASSLSYVERKAIGAAFLIVGFWAGGPPLAAALLEDYDRQFAQLILGLSPVCPCWRAFQSNYIIDPLQYWASTASTICLSALLLSLASRIAARVWRDRPQQSSSRGESWGGRLLGPPEVRKEYRRHLLEINPIYWLASRYPQVRFYPWIFLTFMAAVWCWMHFVDRDFVRLEGTAVTFFVIHFIFKYWFANAACYGFNTDRDQGALEIILCTPLRVPDILRGQWLALGRMFFWPFATLLLVELLLTLGNSSPGLSASLDPPDLKEVRAWTLFAAFSALLLLTDCAALGWLGFWQSLHSKTPHRAATAAMAGVLTLPTIIFLFILGVCAFVGDGMSGGLFVTVWLALGLITDFLVIVAVRRRLQLNLRALISEQSAARAVRE